MPDKSDAWGLVGAVIGGIVALGFTPILLIVFGSAIFSFVAVKIVIKANRTEGTDAQKLISIAVKNKEISREKAEELLINLESNKITPDSIKAMFGEL